MEPTEASPCIGGLERRVEKRGGDASGFELVDLVFHQGDEGGNDHCQALAKESGKLKTKRLSSAGRQESKDVAPVQ